MMEKGAAGGTAKGLAAITFMLAMHVVGASCASPHDAASRGAVEVATRATFMHVGFGAGPVVYTSDDGHLLEERRYEPFGAPIDAHLRTSVGDVLGSPDLAARDLNALNKRSDAATGWSDHGARWMAPETGRWLSPDPLVASPSETFMASPWSLHPYQYADANPVAYWDPDGRQADVIAGPVTAALLHLTTAAVRNESVSGVGELAVPITLIGAVIALPFAVAIDNPQSGAAQGLCIECTVVSSLHEELALRRRQAQALADALEAQAQTIESSTRDAVRARTTARLERDAARRGDGERSYRMIAHVKDGDTIASAVLIESHNPIQVWEVADGVSRAISDTKLGSLYYHGLKQADVLLYQKLVTTTQQGGVAGWGVVASVPVAGSEPTVSLEVLNVEGHNLKGL